MACLCVVDEVLAELNLAKVICRNHRETSHHDCRDVPRIYQRNAQQQSAAQE